MNHCVLFRTLQDRQDEWWDAPLAALNRFGASISAAIAATIYRTTRRGDAAAMLAAAAGKRCRFPLIVLTVTAINLHCS
jgi:hypothetical protein